MSCRDAHAFPTYARLTRLRFGSSTSKNKSRKIPNPNDCWWYGLVFGLLRCCHIISTILLPPMRFPHLLLAAIATYPHLTEAYMQERLVKSAPGPSDSCSSATSDVSTSTTATTTTKNATNANDQSECNVNANDSQRYGDTDISSMR